MGDSRESKGEGEEEGEGALIPFLRRPEVWRAVVAVGAGVGRGGVWMVDIMQRVGLLWITN